MRYLCWVVLFVGTLYHVQALVPAMQHASSELRSALEAAQVNFEQLGGGGGSGAVVGPTAAAARIALSNAWYAVGADIQKRSVESVGRAAARDAFRRAVELLPSSAAANAARNDLGLLLLEQGDRSGARALLERVIELELPPGGGKGDGEGSRGGGGPGATAGPTADQGYAWAALNNLAATTNDPRQRMVWWRRAVALRPHDHRPVVNLGYQLENSGQVREAIELYDSARRSSGNFAGAARSTMAMELLSSTAAPATFDAPDDEPEGGDGHGAADVRDLPGVDSAAAWRRRLFRRMLALSARVGVDWDQLVRSPQTYSLPPRRLLPDSAVITDPLRDVGSFPFRPAYQGYENLRFHAVLSAVYRVVAPALSDVARCAAFPPPQVQVPPSPPPLQPHAEHMRRVRVGLVSEYFGNTSPSKLLAGVFEQLGRGDARTCFDIVYFARLEASQSEDGEHQDELLLAMERRAAEAVAGAAVGGCTTTVRVVRIPADVAGARHTIGSARLHVLLYVALGTNTLSYLLSFARLAPVQAAFAHGHPLTSGHAHTIDYVVSSELFHLDGAADYEELLLRSEEATGHELMAATGGGAEEVMARATGGAGGHPAYTEQLVLFSSLTSYYADPAKAAVAKSPPGTPWPTRDELFGEFGYPALPSVQDAGVAAGATAVGGGVQPQAAADLEAAWQADEGWTLYACLQHRMKFHPGFDDALAAVLLTDPRARILLLVSAKKRHLPRLERRFRELGVDREEASAITRAGSGSRGAAVYGELLTADGSVRRMATKRLLFLPLASPEGHLARLRAADVVLDPFPWGGGVTTFEAFSVCTPVVALPATTSVLQLTLGQMRVLGVAEELTARDVGHYARLAVSVANGEALRARLSHTICTRKGALLFEQRSAVQEWERWLVAVSSDAVVAGTLEQAAPRTEPGMGPVCDSDWETWHGVPGAPAGSAPPQESRGDGTGTDARHRDSGTGGKKESVILPLAPHVWGTEQVGDGAQLLVRTVDAFCREHWVSEAGCVQVLQAAQRTSQDARHARALGTQRSDEKLTLRLELEHSRSKSLHIDGTAHEVHFVRSDPTATAAAAAALCQRQQLGAEDCEKLRGYLVAEHGKAFGSQFGLPAHLL